MPASDRTLRAIGRDEPLVIAALIQRVAPELIPPGATLTPLDVLDPNVDYGHIAKEADWLAHAGSGCLIHVEGQGYRDSEVNERIWYYSVGISLRFPSHKVITVAIWLIVPPDRQRASEIEQGSITVKVRVIVIPELSAELLLGDPLTACFAAGADPGEMSEEELCERVMRTLVENNASPRQRAMAFVVADMVGRYTMLTEAAKKIDAEPVILEDLYYLMHDKGLEKGRKEGRLVEARAALRRVLAHRRLALAPEDDARIEVCEDLAALERWHDQAIDATSAANALC